MLLPRPCLNLLFTLYMSEQFTPQFENNKSESNELSPDRERLKKFGPLIISSVIEVLDENEK